MLIHDRRRCRIRSQKELRDLLNPSQLIQLSRLEREGWRLRFVRERTGQLPLTVLGSRDQTHAVLHSDGRLRQGGTLAVRDAQSPASVVS